MSADETTPAEWDIAHLTASRIPAPETPRKIVQIATMAESDAELAELFAGFELSSCGRVLIRSWIGSDNSEYFALPAIPQGPVA